jgi:hypothetical protein
VNTIAWLLAKGTDLTSPFESIRSAPLVTPELRIATVYRIIVAVLGLNPRGITPGYVTVVGTETEVFPCLVESCIVTSFPVLVNMKVDAVVTPSDDSMVTERVVVSRSSSDAPTDTYPAVAIALVCV